MDLVGNLIGVALGGTIAVLGQTLVPHFAAKRERQKAQSLVRAYLIGTIAIAKARKHEVWARELIKIWSAGKDIPIDFAGVDSFQHDPSEQQTLWLQTTMLRREDAADLATFIQTIRAVRINLRMMNDEPFKKLPPAHRVPHLQWALDQWLEAESIAARLIARL